MRAKYINEKFTEDGDPIRDMGIGIFTKRMFTSIDKKMEWIADNLAGILSVNEMPEDILTQEGSFIRDEYFNILEKFSREYLGGGTDPKILRNILKGRGFSTKKDEND